MSVALRAGITLSCALVLPPLFTRCGIGNDAPAHSGGTTQPRRVEFALVPTAAAQSRFGIQAGDTLSAIGVEAVPVGVRNAAAQAELSAAFGPRFDPRCTRFYHQGESYIVWLGAGCFVPAESLGPHSEAVLLLNPEGIPKDSVVRWPKLEDYFEYVLP